MELTFDCPECGKALLVYVPGTNLVTGKPLDPIESECMEAGISAMQSGFLFVDSTTNDRCPSCGAALNSGGKSAVFDFAIMTGKVENIPLPNDFDHADTDVGKSDILH